MSITPIAPVDPEPRLRLARNARVVWTLEGLLAAIPLALVAILGPLLLDEVGAPGWVSPVLVAAAVLGALVGVALVPQLRWARWRYEVRDEEVDLRRGTVTVVRTVVPMARIQHVETQRTFLSQVTGTANLVLHTAGGQVTIPVLAEEVAVELRERIAVLARMPDADDGPHATGPGGAVAAAPPPATPVVPFPAIPDGRDDHGR